MQGHALHARVCGRVHSFLDRQLMEMAEMFMNEDRLFLRYIVEQYN